MNKIKYGMKFFVVPYGMCTVVNYDDTSGKYLVQTLVSSETFYVDAKKLKQSRKKRD